MNIHYETLTEEIALSAAKQLPWAYIRKSEAVYLGKTPDTFSRDGLIEARWFDGVEEIRAFRQDETFTYCRVSPGQDAPMKTHTYLLVNKKTFGSSLNVTELLDTDEDGQAFVSDVILTGWEG